MEGKQTKLSYSNSPGDILDVCGNCFRVIERFRRIGTGIGQSLIPDVHAQSTACKMRVFYVVENAENEKRFLKVSFGEKTWSMKNEHRMLTAYQNLRLQHEEFAVRLVQVHGYDPTPKREVLVLEYLEGFQKVHTCGAFIAKARCGALVTGICKWCNLTGEPSFDLSANNMLARKTDDGVEVCLVDPNLGFFWKRGAVAFRWTALGGLSGTKTRQQWLDAYGDK